MSEALYNLTIIRHSSSKPVEKLVRDLLEIMGKTGDSYLEYKLSESLLFEQGSSAILEDITLAEGERYQQLFAEQQVETKLNPALQLVAKEDSGSKTDEPYTCPACEHQQPKVAENADVCEKCGVAGEKYEQKLRKQQKRKEIYEAEKKKLDKAQVESLRMAQVHAEHEEAEELRNDARNKLGFKKENQTAIAVVSVVAVLAMGVISYFIFEEMNVRTEQEASQGISQVAEAGATASGQVSGKPGKKLTTDQALQAIQTLTGNANGAAGVQGNDAPQGGLGAQEATVATELATTTANQLSATVAPVPEKLSAQQLEELVAILKSTKTYTFGHTDSGQYAKHLPKLERLLELGKPDFGVVFAENVSDPYSAALLILRVAQSEQKKGSYVHSDDILLSMKEVAVSAGSDDLSPLLTSVLSQVHALTGDNESAEKLLDKAIEEAASTAEIPKQNIQLLSRMLVNHQHLNHSAGTDKLTKKLEGLAVSAGLGTEDSQLMISRVYTHLASISIGTGDIADAANWLKKVPGKENSQYLQARLDSF